MTPIAAARECEAQSPSWRFYNGVRIAALHVLYPEMANVREGTAWLDSEHPSFKEGFLEASALFGMAGAASEPPLRLPLPQPTDVRAGLDGRNQATSSKAVVARG